MMNPTPFPYVRPHTSVLLKAGCIQGISRDITGDVVPYDELDHETMLKAWVDGLTIKTKFGFFCFSKQSLDQLLFKNLVKFYG